MQHNDGSASRRSEFTVVHRVPISDIQKHVPYSVLRLFLLRLEDELVRESDDPTRKALRSNLSNILLSLAEREELLEFEEYPVAFVDPIRLAALLSIFANILLRLVERVERFELEERGLEVGPRTTIRRRVPRVGPVCTRRFR